MKKGELTQIKGLSINELNRKAKSLKLEIDNLVMDKNMKKLKSLKMIGKKRKDLAKVLTVIRQKELVEALGSEESKV